MILVSAGHNEKSQGASYNGVTEFKLANLWVDLIVELIGENAIRVPSGGLVDKVDFINESDATIAVEIHFNSFKKWEDLNGNGIVDAGEMIALGRGSETLYMPASTSGRQAADIVQSSLGHLMQPDRGIKEGWYQLNPSKGADYFLRATKCTALIIEPEFIDNLKDITSNMNAACHIIASSLIEIYNKNKAQ